MTESQSKHEFHRLEAVIPMKGLILGCKFTNGAIKIYDMFPLSRENTEYRFLSDHPRLIRKAAVSPDGNEIIWNDNLALSAEEVWRNGWPSKWDENNLETIEIEIDPELYQVAMEYLRFFGLTAEDFAIMVLEFLARFMAPLIPGKTYPIRQQYTQEENYEKL